MFWVHAWSGTVASPNVGIRTTGGDMVPSSFVIVPVPVPVPIAALMPLLSATTTVSSGSSSVSPVTDTVISRVVVPAAKVRVPPVMAV